MFVGRRRTNALYVHVPLPALLFIGENGVFSPPRTYDLVDCILIPEDKYCSTCEGAGSDLENPLDHLREFGSRVCSLVGVPLHLLIYATGHTTWYSQSLSSSYTKSRLVPA